MSNEMTPKEAFQRIESVIELADDSVNTNTATGRELEEAIIRINDNIKLVRQALTELEFYKSFPQLQEASLIPEVNLKLVTCELQLRELRRDVKRFNELRATFRCAPETLSVDDIKEYEVLSDKIWKVGNEK